MEHTVIENAARGAAAKHLLRFTRFLDPAEMEDAQILARQYDLTVTAFGGYPDAERRIACFVPEGECPPEITEYPLVCLHSAYDARYASLSHRDVLGAFMALGLTRDCVGDMIVRDSQVYLFAVDTSQEYIRDNLTQAGKAGLRFRQIPFPAQSSLVSGTYRKATVASLRADVLVAEAFDLSRAAAADAIHRGLVKVDWRACQRVDVPLQAPAMLSLKGRGRVRLCSVDGMTKKQKFGITLFTFH